MSPENVTGGLRPCDSHEVSQLNELKYDIDILREIQHIKDINAILMFEQMPIIGGFTGTVEATAVVDVATTMASFCLLGGGTYHLDGPIHVRWGTTTARETCQVAGHCGLAHDRNTPFMLANQYYTLAGPCTDYVILELATQSITDTASGRELKSGVAAAKGVALDYTTGIEARAMGEVSIATCKLNTPKANEVLNSVLAAHESVEKYKTAPKGKTFQQCYDVETVLPSDEWLNAYAKGMKKLEECGLPLKGIW